MKLASFDLGTSTGVARWDGLFIQTYTVELASEKDLRVARRLRMDRRLDPRAIRFTRLLTDVCSRPDSRPDYFIFEDVRFIRSSAQAHLWGTWRGILWAVAMLNGVEVECLDTAKLKKFATGSGSADKSCMARALTEKYPVDYCIEKGLVRNVRQGTLMSDDEVDAAHLLDWAMQNIKS